MYNPTREQARQFFVATWAKHHQGGVLTALEAQALAAILQHPEYHAELERTDALTADYTVESGRTNPFLHLAMHLAITEQVSIDHPHGIRAAHQQLAARFDAHRAEHDIMECLGQVVWEAQRLGTPLDSDAYLELIRQRALR